MGSSITEIREDLVEGEGKTTQFDMKSLKSALSARKTELAKLQKVGAPDRDIYYVMGQIELLKDLITAHGERAGGTRRRRRGRKSKGGKTLRRRTTKK